MTTKHWLGTAAIVLAIGTGSGVAIAQTQPDTKHEGARGPAAASQHESARPGGASEAKGGSAGERAASEMKQGAKEAASPSSREQAESRQSPHEGKATVGESAEQHGKDAAETRQKQGAADERKGDNKGDNRAAETNKAEPNKAESNKTETNKAETNKPETNRAESAKSAQPGQRQDQQAHDARPGGATQQSEDQRRGKEPERAADKQQPGTAPSNQAAQPAQPGNATAQQSTPDARQRNAAGQNPTDRGRSGTTVSVNDQQRTQVIDHLRRDREFDQARTNVDISINVGERLPEQVRPRPLPADIVTIVPQYRDYEYTVVHDEIAIVDPRSREIVDVIPQGGVSAERGGYGVDRTRVTLSDEQRQILRRAATDAGTVGSTASSSSGPTCLSLRRVPDELARSNPDLASYQYLAIGDQFVLVDPQNQKIVQVIDQQQ
jgi:Protein of unknown function (DUF1236)